jgi:putative peptide modification system cyclase
MDIAVHTFEPTPEPSPRPSTNAPQLRTLLLTDLVDSTGLVERLGDTPASDLFRAHDRLVLQLQQQWRGRLIDRSDGLLLLFERPIDGLGFALDYARGLIALGTERRIELRARAGMHVGEVLTWRNSDEAVSVGAKPLEVEGLAKPIAARLMAMARPGQILLSAVAEPLAHRAARELGERGQHLLWKSWGRWRFKGVPEAQQVFEVGEPGIAPLRMPPSTPKAWRDIPLWRRPAALAAEVALLAGAALGLWFIARPEPAIAFNQRDWVVVGDLRNLTGQSALDDSLEQAFRISLEQSRHVNVLSDLKARDTLGRMRRAPDTVLDRAVASEIAVRDGARAVILPTVAEIGGRVRVSAEVIDPRTQTTVYTESADGRGVESSLQSIDAVTAALRGRLGEAVKTIEKDSAPLPEVTTSNLDALRAYALGQKLYGSGDYEGALQYYQRAATLDPKFALAWIGQMRAHYAQADTAAALIPLRRAQALREHLAPREALYLDAWVAGFDDQASATKKWIELARLYPDYGPGLSNAAMWLGKDNRHAEVLEFANSAIKLPQVDVGIDFDAKGRAYLAMGQFPQAAQAFNQAIGKGYPGSVRRQAALEAARRDFAAAQRYEQQLDSRNRHAYIERTSIAIDRGDWKAAQALARTGHGMAEKGSADERMLLIPVAVADWLAGQNASALRHAQDAGHAALAALNKSGLDAEDDALVAITAALLAQRLGDEALAKSVLEFLQAHPELGRIPNVEDLATVLGAEQERRSGHPLKAVALLESRLNGREHYQAHVALMEAYADSANSAAALEQSRWLQQRRGLAYAELDCGNCRQALNVADSAIAARREKELQRQSATTAAAEPRS